VRQLTGGIEFLFKKNGVEYVQGWGKFLGNGEVEVSGEEETSVVKGKNIIIATGSIPSPLPPLPVDNSQFKIVDSTGALGEFD